MNVRDIKTRDIQSIRQSLKSDWKNLWKENENVSQSNIIRSH